MAAHLVTLDPDGVRGRTTSLLEFAARAASDSVTDNCPHRERDSEPAQEHDSHERCPAHTLTIGSELMAPLRMVGSVVGDVVP